MSNEIRKASRAHSTQTELYETNKLHGISSVVSKGGGVLKINISSSVEFQGDNQAERLQKLPHSFNTKTWVWGPSWHPSHTALAPTKVLNFLPSKDYPKSFRLAAGHGRSETRVPRPDHGRLSKLMKVTGRSPTIFYLPPWIRASHLSPRCTLSWY